MKLTERLPDTVIVDGRKVRVNLEFRNVLRMMEIMQDDYLMQDARMYKAAKCVVRGRIRQPERIMNELRKLLFPKARHESGKRLTSYEQDAGFIRAAFRQVYGIDLWREKLHWLEFRELLDGLTEGNKYTEIIGIRARDIPAPTKYNRKEIEWLMEAKRAYALEMTEEERMGQYDRDVKKIFSVLSCLAGSVNNGE